MWWSKPPSPEELNERGYRAIWSSPFLDAIETIERCNLTSENPSLRGDEGIADKSPHVTVKTLSKPPNKPSVELLVDVPPLRATLRTAEGEKLFDLPSEGVARWLKVLAEHPDEWIRPADYKTHGGDELDGVKPSDQLRSLKTMCPKLAKLIEPSKHNGMRFNPAPVAK
ncbi:hypothetical protein LBMAG52_45200 [Planctomycetia bacterium]|nr:hypothetical protein LBMAG52_45200 [Planctomycetia bacterium]